MDYPGLALGAAARVILAFKSLVKLPIASQKYSALSHRLCLHCNFERRHILGKTTNIGIK